MALVSELALGAVMEPGVVSALVSALESGAALVLASVLALVSASALDAALGSARCWCGLRRHALSRGDGVIARQIVVVHVAMNAVVSVNGPVIYIAPYYIVIDRDVVIRVVDVNIGYM